MAFGAISKIAEVVAPLISEFVTDKDKQNELKHRIESMLITNEHVRALREIDLVEGQLKINLQEAKSGKTFVSGWRPYLGWGLGTALIYNFLLRPIVQSVINIVDAFITTDLSAVVLVELDVEQLWPLLLGLLGIGGYRSFEKIKGVARKDLRE